MLGIKPENMRSCIPAGRKIPKKIKLRAHSGPNFGTEKALSEKAASFKKRKLVRRYSVKTAIEWQHSVASAPEISSVVPALQQVKQRLSGMSTEY